MFRFYLVECLSYTLHTVRSFLPFTTYLNCCDGGVTYHFHQDRLAHNAPNPLPIFSNRAMRQPYAY